jgi:hypothetical protein
MESMMTGVALAIFRLPTSAWNTKKQNHYQVSLWVGRFRYYYFR